MPLFIEIGNNVIKIASVKNNRGKLIVDRFETLSTLTDPASLMNIKDNIIDLGFKTRDVSILLNSNVVIYRELRIPLIEKKKALAVVANELAGIQTVKVELVAEFIPIQVLEEEKMQRVLSFAIPTNLMISMIGWLNSVKFSKISAFGIGQIALLEYIKNTSLKTLTVPYLLIDITQGLTKFYLFDEGSFILMRTARLDYNNKNEMITTLTNEISLMQQFQLSRRYQANMEQVYLFGDYAQLDELALELQTVVPLTIEIMPALESLKCSEGFEYLANIYLLGAALNKNKSVDLLRRFNVNNKAKKKIKKETVKSIALFSAYTIALAGVAGYYYVKNNKIVEEINAERVFVDDPANKALVASIMEEKSKVELIDGLIAEVKKVREIQDYIPDFTSPIDLILNGYKGVTVVGYQYSVPNLSLSLTCNNQFVPPYYVDYLMETQLFKSVKYNGFTYSIETGECTFTLECELNRGGDDETH